MDLVDENEDVLMTNMVLQSTVYIVLNSIVTQKQQCDMSPHFMQFAGCDHPVVVRKCI